MLLAAPSDRPVRRPSRVRPRGRDVGRAIVAALAAAIVSQVLRDRSGDPLSLPTVIAIALACAPVAFWSSSPVVAAFLMLLVAVAGTVAGLTMAGATLFALAAVALAAGGARARTSTTLGLLSGAGIAVAAGVTADSRPVLAAFGGFAVGLLPAMLGERLRVERARARAATELALRVEELRDRDVQRAVAEERLRIARDVHDITGHHLSAISLQAAGAARTTADPAARTALTRIHGLTSDALGQTRRALGVLRADDEELALAPPPRLAHVAPLLEPARTAGIDARLEVRGAVRDLPDTVELCAYRVVQESVTNVLRHADARSLDVVLDYGREALRIAIEDDGAGAAGDAGRDAGTAAAGSGIQGMRERLALVGGDLAVGAGARGGWSVRAVVPLEGGR